MSSMLLCASVAALVGAVLRLLAARQATSDLSMLVAIACACLWAYLAGLEA